MPTFLYKYIDDNKKHIYGNLIANDIEIAKKKIGETSNNQIEICETMTNFKTKIEYKELSVFSRQMSILYKAKIPLSEGLLLVKEQVWSNQLKYAILEIHKLINEGMEFSTAIAMFSHVFDDYFINIIKIAEESDTYEKSFDELYDYYIKQESFTKKIKGMLVYPSILLGILICLVSFVIIKIMPIFNTMLTDYGIKIPSLTKTVINISIWINNNIVIIISVVAILIIGSVLYFRTKKGNKVFKKIIYKYLLFNKIETKLLAIKFSKSMGNLLNSNLELTKAIELSNLLLQETEYFKKIDEMKEKIIKGENFYYCIQETGVYPSLYSKILSMGKDIGDLGNSFYDVSNMLEDDLEVEIENLQKLIEPVTMLILGGVVLVILVSVALPMINILSNIA